MKNVTKNRVVWALIVVIAAALLAMAVSGCIATTSDIDRIEQALVEYDKGLLSVADVRTELDGVRADIEDRGSRYLEAALGISALVTGAGGAGLHMYRNRTRSRALRQTKDSA